MPSPASIVVPVEVRELAERLGREDAALPAYVYDLDGLTAHLAVIRAALPDCLEFCYAVKANPDPTVLRVVAQRADCLEVASGGELAHVAATVPGARLTFGGPGKTPAELAAAVRAGVSRFHVESPHELRLLAAAALAAGRTADILLRVNLPPDPPPIASSPTPTASPAPTPPHAPGTPPTPTMPSAPGTPHAPTVPSAPGTPHAPTVSPAPGTPATPTVPPAPTASPAPGMPPAPGVAPVSGIALASGVATASSALSAPEETGPDPAAPASEAGLVMGGGPTPFGMDPFLLDGCARWLAEGSREARAVRLRGLHAHLASGLDAPALIASAGRLLDFARRWCARHGVRDPEFNLGGGMAVNYRRPGERFDWAAYGRGLAQAARPGETLRIEPGRAVTAYCGWYVTRVLDVKPSHGKAFAVVAGGTHHLRTPAAKGHDQPLAVLPVAAWPHDWPRPAAPAGPVTIAGQLCTPKDILARDVELPGLRAGDLVAFGMAGAYAWNISHHAFLMHPEPAFHYLDSR
jgi:diaminopimelate decarboxylase